MEQLLEVHTKQKEDKFLLSLTLEAGRSKRVKNNSTEKKQKAQFSIS
jgi:hypothetical protein